MSIELRVTTTAGMQEVEQCMEQLPSDEGQKKRDKEQSIQEINFKAERTTVSYEYLKFILSG